MARAVCLVDRDTALRERERLLVAVLEHHHARLVATNRSEHIVGVDERRETLGLAERGHGFVVAAELGEGDARQRMHQRQMAAIPGCVERGRRLGDVLAYGGDVADVPVALSELVVREAYAP